MKKLWWVLVAIVLLIAVAVIITIIVNKQREKRVNHFEFPVTMIAKNYTTEKRADTMAMIILNKIFKYDTVTLNIYYAPKHLNNSEYELVGFIQKNPYEEHSYNIFLKNGTLPVSIKTFLSHELVHLQQMEKGDLVQLSLYEKIIYKNDTIYYSEVPYDKRPYEIDAFSKENKIRKGLNDLLYRK